MAICKECGKEYYCRSDSIEAYDSDKNPIDITEYDGEVIFGQYCRSCKCPWCIKGPDIGPDAIRLNYDEVVPY